MNMTRKPVTNVHMKLMATRLCPTESASFTASGSVLAWAVYSSNAFLASMNAFILASTFLSSALNSVGAAGANKPFGDWASTARPVASPAGSGLGVVSAGAAAAAAFVPMGGALVVAMGALVVCARVTSVPNSSNATPQAKIFFVIVFIGMVRFIFSFLGLIGSLRCRADSRHVFPQSMANARQIKYF